MPGEMPMQPAKDDIPGGVATGVAGAVVVHGRATQRSNSWYQTRKGRLVILTGLLLAAAWSVKLIVPQAGLVGVQPGLPQ